MELVASVKMRKASQAAVATRAYGDQAWEMLQAVAQAAQPHQHGLLRNPVTVKKVAVVIIASNRGLVGGFNSNLLSAVAKQIMAMKEDMNAEVEVVTMGSKGRAIATQHHQAIVADFLKQDIATSALDIRPMASFVTDRFRSEEYDRVYVSYMHYQSSLVQRPVVRQVLPLIVPTDEQLISSDVLFEPTPDSVLEALVPRLVEMQFYRAVLETNASEHAARMVAMKNASDSANDLIDDLSLTYNQARQAAITQDLSEISAGRAALEG